MSDCDVVVIVIRSWCGACRSAAGTILLLPVDIPSVVQCSTHPSVVLDDVISYRLRGCNNFSMRSFVNLRLVGRCCYIYVVRRWLITHIVCKSIHKK